MAFHIDPNEWQSFKDRIEEIASLHKDGLEDMASEIQECQERIDDLVGQYNDSLKEAQTLIESIGGEMREIKDAMDLEFNAQTSDEWDRQGHSSEDIDLWLSELEDIVCSVQDVSFMEIDYCGLTEFYHEELEDVVPNAFDDDFRMKP
jgi:methyl-accepting chemotaxis protein